MTPDLERAARACAAQRKSDDIASGFPIVEHRYEPPLPMDVRAARAVLLAIREPSADVLALVEDQAEDIDAISREVWQAMIDAILGEAK